MKTKKLSKRALAALAERRKKRQKTKKPAAEFAWQRVEGVAAVKDTGVISRGPHPDVEAELERVRSLHMHETTAVPLILRHEPHSAYRTRAQSAQTEVTIMETAAMAIALEEATRRGVDTLVWTDFSEGERYRYLRKAIAAKAAFDAAAQGGS